MNKLWFLLWPERFVCFRYNKSRFATQQVLLCTFTYSLHSPTYLFLLIFLDFQVYSKGFNITFCSSLQWGRCWAYVTLRSLLKFQSPAFVWGRYRELLALSQGVFLDESLDCWTCKPAVVHFKGHSDGHCKPAFPGEFSSWDSRSGDRGFPEEGESHAEQWNSPVELTSGTHQKFF